MVSCALLSSASLFALGAVGGYNNNSEPYGILISDNGVAIPLTGDVPLASGEIYSVAVNASGVAMMGGIHNLNTAYAVLVAPNGEATFVTGEVPGVGGTVFSVGINNSGAGIIGGNQNTAFDPYVALVSPAGVATELTGAAPSPGGVINSVAINNNGAAIVGGRDNSLADPYVAIVSPSGVATELTGDAPVSSGNILAVAINDSGAGLVGGNDGGGLQPYAAIVSSTGVASALTGGTPSGDGKINSVAVNDTGTGVIGGYDSGTQNSYAAFVSPSGVATALTGLPGAGGDIQGVDINNDGAAIIGGVNPGNTPYASLVSSSGTLTSISGTLPVGSGVIRSVAISDEGVGLIGGGDGTSLFVALVSPSGIATDITGVVPISVGEINSVAFPRSDSAILAAAVPGSIGPGNAYANGLFTLSSQVLPNHISTMMDHTSGYNKSSDDNIGLLADATDVVRGNISCNDDTKYAIWSAPFGAYAHNKKGQSSPSATNWIGGTVLGFDYRGIKNTIIGAGAAYAFNRVNYSGNNGHSRIHQEFLTVYGSWGRNHLLIDAALWGGLYQIHNKRVTLGTINSKSHINGWLLSPHFRLSTPFYAKGDWFIIAPFVMLDWANNWQGKIRETGSSGMNIRTGSHYTSMLRSEIGLNFYETIRYGWGNLIFAEKGSYVNKKPFNTGSQSAFFAGSASTFGIEVFGGKTQNLGVVQLSSQFIPCSHRYPYGSINYQGEFGTQFQSHAIIFEIGKRF